MYLLPPSTNPTEVTVARVLAEGPGHGPSSRGWSSLIGVVTAICGNILISFALNTQRYAHIRLNREAARQEKQKAARSKITPSASYGTQQAEVSEEFERRSARPEPNEDALGDVNGSTETDPLIGGVHRRKVSASSEETARADDSEADSKKEKSYLKSPIWWLGILMMVAGEAGNFLAYGFAPASLVSPLGVVALISNWLIAPLLLGERFRWRDGLGVAIAIFGCVVVVLSASDSDPKLTADAIWELVKRWEFLTYLGITIVAIVALAVASNRIGDRSILIDLGIVALFGAYTALSTKGVASLLSNTIWRVVTFPITYLLLAVLIFTAVMQIKYLNRALRRFNATMVIPTQFVLFTISVIVGSAVLYQDFQRQSGEDAAKFVCGCALTFFGVWCITTGREDESIDDKDFDESDGMNLRDAEAAIPEVQDRDEATTHKPAPSVTAGSGSLPQSHNAEFTSKSEPVLANQSANPSNAPRTDTSLSDADDNQLVTVEPGDGLLPKPTSTAPLDSESPLRPLQFHSTASEPNIPTVENFSSSLRPKTPLSRTPSASITESASKSSVTPRASHLDPHGSHRFINRHSVVGLLPGPLTSPLSSSLSAVVADNLRRGVPLNRSATGSIRRQKSGRLQTSSRVPETPSPTVAGPKRHSIASGEEIDFDTEEPADTTTGLRPAKNRIRSLSATLSDFLGSKGRSPRRAAQRNRDENLKPETSRQRSNISNSPSVIVTGDEQRQGNDAFG